LYGYIYTKEIANRQNSNFTGSQRWRIQHAIREYQASLEKLKELEKDISWEEGAQ